jgi:hypothetical protein
VAACLAQSSWSYDPRLVYHSDFSILPP